VGTGTPPLGVADKSKEAVRHPWCLCFDAHLDAARTLHDELTDPAIAAEG